MEKIEADRPLSSLGRYRIDASIGEGAMAHVYLAHDPSIDRRLAIKVLKPEFRGNPEVVRRFLAESRAAGMLSHAHIVTIYDVGEANGIAYIAMEYLEGDPLEVVLEREGRLTVERVLTLGAQISAALAYAHGHGVIHRDIKPSNILICEDGRSAKLLDFGIARIDARDRKSADSDASRTQAGQVMGTPRYMSPEQAMGLPVDARSDLFSFGAVLYEMITGKAAFSGSGLATLAIQIAQKPPLAIATHTLDCPRGLVFIIDKLLAKKPTERFADAESLHKALAREREALSGREAPRRGLALRVKLPLTLALTTAIALSVSIALVVDHQKATLTQMAATSGSSMTEFVARNVALRVAENAGLPAAEQDWQPLQAFAQSAAMDQNIKQLVIADDRGIIRATGDAHFVGTPYRALPNAGSGSNDADRFRFVRPVRYAGHDFGLVDMTIGRAALNQAIANTWLLLMGLATFIVLFVAAIGYWSARQVSQPLRRLQSAMIEAASGDTAFRLSHRRADEVGVLFDAFNQLVDGIDVASTDRPLGSVSTAMDKTRIGNTADRTVRNNGLKEA